jgi:glutamate/tyrosine decarboxylase-like PLP-dependent enzyme
VADEIDRVLERPRPAPPSPSTACPTVRCGRRTSAWDQNAGLLVSSPAAAVVESVAAGWALELLGLPPDASVGLLTGATMANFTGLAAARHHVLAETGWDVERDGLQDAPRVNVIAGAERHATLDATLDTALR